MAVGTPGRGVRHGTVHDYDEAAGLGTVVDDADGTALAFHCTAIADGSRHIAVGTRVAFTVRAGHLGRWEATGLVTRP